MGLTERKWLAIPARAFTANGTSEGVVTVASTVDFRVKQKATIRASLLPPLTVEIKRVLSKTQLAVGPAGAIDNRTNLTPYTTAAGSTVEIDDQVRSAIPLQELNRAIYMEEPIMAIRSFSVDEFGNPYTADNPLPVAAVFDGDVKVGDIRITAADDDPIPGNIHSSVRISDGVNEVGVNADKSINVHVLAGGGGSTPAKNIYEEALSVASGALTDLSSYTVPPTKTGIIEKIVVSGENIAKYTVLLNGDVIETCRTYLGSSLNATFDFTSPNGLGYSLVAGDVIEVKVIHNRPSPGDFNSRIQVVEL